MEGKCYQIITLMTKKVVHSITLFCSIPGKYFVFYITFMSGNFCEFGKCLGKFWLVLGN